MLLMMELLTENSLFTALASTCNSFLKANAMLNFNNTASIYFYAALIIHLQLHRRHPQRGQIQQTPSGTGAKLKQCLAQQQHFH